MAGRLMKHRDASDSKRYRVLSKKFIEKYGIDTEGYDVITPIVICNSDQFTAIEPHTGTVSVGDVVLTLKK